MRAVDARPVKKVAEARARKKKRLQVSNCMHAAVVAFVHASAIACHTRCASMLGSSRAAHMRVCKHAGLVGTAFKYWFAFEAAMHACLDPGR